MIRLKYLVFVATLAFQASQLAAADTFSEGSIVYFETHGGASSSTQAPSVGHWIGKVQKALKSGLVEVLPTHLNGVEQDMPKIYKQAHELSPSVNEKGGFSAGKIVTLKNFGGKGVILRVFDNGMAQVNWLPGFSHTGGVATLNVVSLNELRHAHATSASSALGLVVGQTVFVHQKIPEFDLRSKMKVTEPSVPVGGERPIPIEREVRTTSKYEIANLNLGFLPYVGKIVEVSSAAPVGGPETQLVSVSIEKQNGVNLKVAKTITVEARFLSPEITSEFGQGTGLKKGDAVTYASDRGIKPYKFSGTVQRAFENGILEIQWETKNGKSYDKKYLDYLPVGALKRPQSLGSEGINVVEGEARPFLAIASVERALKKPNSSYLNELDRLVYDRANAVCRAKGLKGLLKEPKLAEISKDDEYLRLAAAENRFSDVRNFPVAPWAFGTHSKMGKLGRTPFLLSTTVAALVGTAGLIASGGSAVLVALPVLAQGGLKAYSHAKTISLEHSQARLEKGKKIYKKFDLFDKKVPGFFFSELICTNNPAEVLTSESSMQFVDLNLAAHIDDIVEIVAQLSSALAQLYQAPDGDELNPDQDGSQDLPPPYKSR